MSFIARAESDLLPFLSIICPKYFILFIKKSHYSSFKWNPSEDIENIFLVFWVFTFQQNILQRSDCKVKTLLSIVTITYSKIAGQTFISKAKRLNLYILPCVFIVSNLEHSSATSISWHVSLRSIFENIWPPISCAKTSSSV